MVPNGAVERVTLANGVTMPCLGLGVWQASDREVERVIPQAVEIGYRLIDTATLYENEAGVGRGIRAAAVPREELFITTKVWNRDQGYERTLAAFEASRKRLGLEYIDLYLIHWAVPDRYPETWRALETLYRDGAVRAVGVSNFVVSHLERILQESELVPMVNQIERHPYHAQTPVVAFCQAHGIQVEAWAPLMRGGPLLSDPAIATIAARHGKTPAQVVLRWHLQHHVIPIPKTVRPERLRENLDVFDFTLSAEEMAALDRLDREQQSFPYDPVAVRFG
ncbi:MAG: aldo/keto reductase [Firmicutes bacterium]|nr:aldo/keto reductase [Alicyclobacillaceae bacterium]MCL6496494.1 aldo/keto reductase [Bacillota bacterium]